MSTFHQTGSEATVSQTATTRAGVSSVPCSGTLQKIWAHWADAGIEPVRDGLTNHQATLPPQCRLMSYEYPNNSLQMSELSKVLYGGGMGVHAYMECLSDSECV